MFTSRSWNRTTFTVGIAKTDTHDVHPFVSQWEVRRALTCVQGLRNWAPFSEGQPCLSSPLTWAEVQLWDSLIIWGFEVNWWSLSHIFLTFSFTILGVTWWLFWNVFARKLYFYQWWGMCTCVCIRLGTFCISSGFLGTISFNVGMAEPWMAGTPLWKGSVCEGKWSEYAPKILIFSQGIHCILIMSWRSPAGRGKTWGVGNLVDHFGLPKLFSCYFNYKRRSLLTQLSTTSFIKNLF